MSIESRYLPMVALMRDVFKTCPTSARPNYPDLISRMSGLEGALSLVAA